MGMAASCTNSRHLGVPLRCRHCPSAFQISQTFIPHRLPPLTHLNASLAALTLPRQPFEIHPHPVAPRRPVHEAFAPDAAAEEPPSKLPRLAFQRPLSGTPGANGRGDVTPGRGDSNSVGDGSGGVEGRTRGRLSAGEVRGRSHSGDEGRVRSMPRGNAEGTGSVGPGSRLAMGAGGMGGGFLNAAGVAGSLGQGARPGGEGVTGAHV